MQDNSHRIQEFQTNIDTVEHANNGNRNIWLKVVAMYKKEHLIGGSYRQITVKVDLIVYVHLNFTTSPTENMYVSISK